MKLYISHSSNFDYQTELYAPLKATLARQHQVFFPHEADVNGVESKDIIAKSDFVLAEVSYPSTGQGIELGWANTSNIPILCFYRAGAHISSALRFVSDRMIEYVSIDDMIQQLKDWAAAQT